MGTFNFRRKSNLLIYHQTKFKFIIVGIWNTIFGYLLFVNLDILFETLLSRRYIAYMAAAVISNIFAIINAFIFHKYFTFQSRIKGKHIIPEFIKFFSMYVLSFVAGLILLPFFIEIISISPKISGALIIPFTTVISYIGHSRFSFKKQSS